MKAEFKVIKSLSGIAEAIILVATTPVATCGNKLHGMTKEIHTPSRTQTVLAGTTIFRDFEAVRLAHTLIIPGN